MKLRKFIFYGLSVGLNRGTIFFLLPLAGFFLNTDDFGIFSLVIITSQLLIPVLTLNVSSVISREFLDEKEMLNKFTSYVFVMLICLNILTLFVGGRYKIFVSYIISEAILMMLITRARFLLGAGIFLASTIIKASSCFISLYTVYIFEKNLLKDIDFFCLVLILSNLTTVFFVCTRDNFIKFSLGIKLSQLGMFLHDNKKFVWFGILLIPHSLSQWVMSSSDRYIIKIFFNSTILGEYSLAYAYASLFMLVISILAIILPEYCVRQYDLFLKSKTLLLYICGMATVYVFSFFIVYFFVLKYICFNYDEMNIFCFVYSSLFYLVMYHYCAAIHFYHKKSSFITKTTLLASLISMLVTVFFAWQGTIIGVAFSTYFSYLCYFLLIRRGISSVNVNVVIGVVLVSAIPLLTRYIHVIS